MNLPLKLQDLDLRCCFTLFRLYATAIWLFLPPVRGLPWSLLNWLYYYLSLLCVGIDAIAAAETIY